MNYDNSGGQVRGPMPRMPPNEYPMNSGGPRPIPSGYPAHALPGNAVRFYPQQQPQPPPQQAMGYPQPRGYYPQPQQQQQFYPGDNGVPRPRQHYFQQQQQQNSQQFYPNQQQGNQQQMFYQQQQAGYQQYPQQYPSQGIRPPPQQQQQQQQGFHQQHNAMMDNSGGSHFYGQEYQQQQPQPPQQFQRFPGYQQQQAGYNMQQHSNNQRQVVPTQPQQSTVASRPVATNFRPPIRTGFRNPGGPAAFYPRPPPQMVRHPQIMPQQQQPQQYQRHQYPATSQNVSSQQQMSGTDQAKWQQPQPQPQATATPSTIPVPVTTVTASQNVIISTNAMTTTSTVTTTTVVTTTVTTPSTSSQHQSSLTSTAPIPVPEIKRVSVPWGWMRTMVLDSIIYRSPSGIELKSPEEIKEYLLKEGTCKCGLECPLELDHVFDFDTEKHSELAPMPVLTPNPSKYCKHKEAVVNLAKILSTPGLATQFKHVHDPSGGKKGGKKRSSRKKRPYSGLLTPQMVEAREAEKRRINEIINQQKQAYEAEMSLSIGGKKSGALVMATPMPTKEQSPVPEVELSSVESSQSSAEINPLEDEVTVLTDDDEDEDNANANNTNAKNIEIRRMSATDEGDKVLEGVWDSPEKEKEGRTPLQMVQSIVSKIEEAKMTSTVTTTTSAPPAWATQGGQRPLLHSQKHIANDTPPTSRVVTSIVPPQQKTPLSQNMTVMAPQLMPTVSGGQQFMQLVNTINGPMLMQTIPAPAPPQIQIHDPSKANNKKKASPGGAAPAQAVAYQPQPNIVQAGSGGPMPILVSPTPMMASQTSPTGVAPAQHVLISHPSPGAPQFVLNQPVIAPNQVFLSANGTLVAMPTAPAAPVVYNQLPDGTLVQVQSPTIMPAQQTVFTTNGSFVINNGGQQVSPNGGQIITNTGGTYIMTPTGLVQTVNAQATPVSSAPTMAAPNQTILDPQPGPSSSTIMERKDSTEKSEDSDDDDDQDSDDDEPKIVKFVQTDEDEEDTSDEEVPLAKKKSPLSLKDTKGKGGKVKNSSPKTYLQSNKVDSSGLQATPPYLHDESESSMKRLSSPEASVSTSMRDDALDTSGSTDGGGPSSSTKSSKRKRKRTADEVIKDNLVQSDDDESDDEEVQFSKNKRQFNVGELVWGPHGTFPSWPGKLVRFERDGSKVLVCWFGNRDTSQVNPDYLKSLSDGLEAHHRERKKLRKGRKMNASLEKAIQEAMMELDRMTDD